MQARPKVPSKTNYSYEGNNNSAATITAHQERARGLVPPIQHVLLLVDSKSQN